MYEHVQTGSDKDGLDAELIANVNAACHELARFLTRSIAHESFRSFRAVEWKIGLLQTFHGLWDG
jgi:hypothetical protein